MQVGDQLLEVCGINLRMANYDQAAQVLYLQYGLIKGSGSRSGPA